MKKILLVAMLFGLMSAAFAEDMTREEIIRTLEKNHLDSLVGLYIKGALVLDAKGTTINKMQLKRNGAVFHEAEASTAQYWYRGMGIAETNQLVEGGYGSVYWDVDSYVGIAPMFTYAASYLTIKNPGAVVEFATDREGWLYGQWYGKHGCQIKAEGGGTYGLGVKGSIASCNKPKFDPPVKALGKVFSGWMQDTVVMTRIVWVLVPRNP